MDTSTDNVNPEIYLEVPGAKHFATVQERMTSRDFDYYDALISLGQEGDKESIWGALTLYENKFREKNRRGLTRKDIDTFLNFTGISMDEDKIAKLIELSEQQSKRELSEYDDPFEELLDEG